MESSSVLGMREAKDDLEMKPIPKQLISEKKEETGLEETPHFAMSLAERKNTVHLSYLSRETKISDIIDFFKDVGDVVHVRLFVNETGENLGYGSVHFASSNEAKNAQKNKNGEYLCGNKITLHVSKIAPYRSMYCLDHKVWSEVCLNETPHFVMSYAERKKTLVLSHLSLETNISDIVDFFKDEGEVVQVRLIVNKDGKNLGYGSVQFDSFNEAKKAQKNKNGEYLCGNKIILDMAKMSQDRPRPRECNSCHLPELDELYALVSMIIEVKSNLSEELTEIIGDEAKAKEIVEAGKTSIGHDLSPVMDLEDYRKKLYDYLVIKMRYIAPNLVALVGEMIGARLISHAGSLKNLAKCPSSTLQTHLRSLKTRGKTPKYGLIFPSSFIQGASGKNKGRIARSLANKCSIASRMDCFSDSRTSTFGEKLRKLLEEQLEFCEKRANLCKNVDVMKEVLENLDLKEVLENIDQKENGGDITMETLD